MVNGFSSIMVYVPQLDAAVEEYSRFLGGFARDADQDKACLPLANVTIELVQSPDVTTARIAGLSLWCQEPIRFPANLRQLFLTQAKRRRAAHAPTVTGIEAVDHVVLRSADADDCIRLFGDDLGMRLALDQSVPEWGGRMLFFRAGKLTLEVIQGSEPPENDHFWGITYLCPNLPATLRALDAAEVAHSGDRKGRKPGTRVATVKSHTLGIPTLLIGPDI